MPFQAVTSSSDNLKMATNTRLSQQCCVVHFIGMMKQRSIWIWFLLQVHVTLDNMSTKYKSSLHQFNKCVHTIHLLHPPGQVHPEWPVGLQPPPKLLWRDPPVVWSVFVSVFSHARPPVPERSVSSLPLVPAALCERDSHTGETGPEEVGFWSCLPELHKEHSPPLALVLEVFPLELVGFCFCIFSTLFLCYILLHPEDSDSFENYYLQHRSLHKWSLWKPPMQATVTAAKTVSWAQRNCPPYVYKLQWVFAMLYINNKTWSSVDASLAVNRQIIKKT